MSGQAASHEDGLCVYMYHWVLGALTGKVSVHTKAATEMFIRRWLRMLKELVT